eukprot:4931263-Prymnesium_polylepis.1
MANLCTASLTGSAQKVPTRRVDRSCLWSASLPFGMVISIRRKVEPALRTVILWHSIIAANRSGGETGEPSRTTEGMRVSSDAAIMYDWP